MVPIPITDFITALAMPVDIYVRLSDEKFVILCKAGTKTSKEQLASYQERDVHYVWVRKTDYYRMSGQSIGIAGLAVKRSDISLEQKTRVLSVAAKTVFHQFEHMGISVSMYNDARMVSDATMALLESHNSYGAFFESLKDCSEELLRHSMAVSFLSTLMGIALGWEKN